MAILYITATTGTGTGTLRDCVSEAAEGDIIQPDPTLFPAGTLCTCSTATAIAFNKSLTIRGAQTRIQLVGGYHSINATSSTAAGKRVVFEDVDFIKGSRSSVAPLYVQYLQYVDFIRCRFMGSSGYYGGALYVYNAASNEVTLKDCAFYGNRATYANTASRGAIYFASGTTGAAGRAKLINCTFGGNYTAYNTSTTNNWNGTCSEETNVVTDTTGWTTPPTISYTTWTNTAYESMDPRPSSSATWKSGATATDSTYDVDGNPRKTSGAKGAYEYYDLYWIGKDSSGTAITTGTYSAASGWATSPTATASGSTVPTSVDSVLITTDTTITGSYSGTVGVGANVDATLDVGGTVLVGKYATVSLIVSGGLVLENTTITAPAITIAPWSYLKLVNTTFNCGSLTIYGAFLSDSDVTVDELNAYDGSYIKLGSGVKLIANVDATFGESYFEGSESYVFVPSDTSYGGALFDDVRPGWHGAGVTSASFSNGTFTWTGTDLDEPITIEIARGTESTTYDRSATGGTKIINAYYQFGDVDATIKAIDGLNEATATAPTTAPSSVLDLD